MGQGEHPRILGPPLPQRRHVQTERLADQPLGSFDLPVDLRSRQVDEFGRKFGEQRFELWAGFEFGGNFDWLLGCHVPARHGVGFFHLPANSGASNARASAVGVVIRWGWVPRWGPGCTRWFRF